MRQESYVDRNFRWYGEAFFGKMAMDRITSEQVEEARVYAFRELANLTARYGEQKKGTVQELFCDYIFSEFI